MVINNLPFSQDLSEILEELQHQLTINNIPLLQTTRDTPYNIMVSCPYHKFGQERRPSAGIKKDDGTFHCFACGETHSLPEMISYCFGKTDDIFGSFGWNWLLKNFQTVSIEDRKAIDLELSREIKTEMPEYVPEAELDTYRYYHPYMWKRKLTPEVVAQFDIGYDKATDCLTFPVRDIHGNCLFVARRSVKTKFFSYPQGVEKPLYGLYELSMFTDLPNCFGISGVFVCESMLDALTCWTYNVPAVALNGLGNDLQFAQLKNLPVRSLIIATDNDEAGEKAAERIRKNVRKIAYRFIFPEGKKDINELTPEEFANCKMRL